MISLTRVSRLSRLRGAVRTMLPRTLLARTFVLLSLLIIGSVGIWLTLFGLAEREPRARQLAQLTVSIVNTTSAALIATADRILTASPPDVADLLGALTDGPPGRLWSTHFMHAEPHCSPGLAAAVAPRLWESGRLIQCASPGKTFNSAGLEASAIAVRGELGLG